MAKLSTKEIVKLAIEIIKGKPGGIRYADLVRTISSQYPETPLNTIHGSVWDLHKKCPQHVIKPSRGLFVPAEANEPGSKEEIVEIVKKDNQELRESDFYKPFADWLKNDLDEVTDSVDLGGAAMEKKWGTPDIVGVYRATTSDLVKFQLEIVSAEVKINAQQPVVAFGQVIAYRLFSAKTYVVMPKTMSEEDKERLESLCMLFGVGLVLFDLNPRDPSFAIRVRAQRFSPDMFFVNEFAERLKEVDSEKFKTLFG